MTENAIANERLGLLINFSTVLIKDGTSPVSSMDWRKNLAQSRKDAKKTGDVTCLSVS
jgi:hypothetical protein